MADYGLSVVNIATPRDTLSKGPWERCGEDACVEYPNDRIKSRTFVDGEYEEYRNENYYGDNMGRKTLSRLATGAETHYLEYWGDASTNERMDDTAIVKLEEVYSSNGALIATNHYDVKIGRASCR